MNESAVYLVYNLNESAVYLVYNLNESAMVLCAVEDDLEGEGVGVEVQAVLDVHPLGCQTKVVEGFANVQVLQNLLFNSGTLGKKMLTIIS